MGSVGFNPPWAWQSAGVKPPESSAKSLSLLALLSVGSAVAVAGVPQNAIAETHTAVIAVPASTDTGRVFMVASVRRGSRPAGGSAAGFWKGRGYALGRSRSVRWLAAHCGPRRQATRLHGR